MTTPRFDAVVFDAPRGHNYNEFSPAGREILLEVALRPDRPKATYVWAMTEKDLEEIPTPVRNRMTHFRVTR